MSSKLETDRRTYGKSDAEEDVRAELQEGVGIFWETVCAKWST